MLIAVLACGATSLALGVSRRRDPRARGAWIGSVPLQTVLVESVMLAAMLDVHLPALGIVPAPLWATLLIGCAIVSALADRLRRGNAGHVPSGHVPSDHLHALGLLLAAVLVLLVGAAGHGVVPTAAPGAHAHGAPAPSVVLALTATGVVVYALVVVGSVLRRRHRGVDTARRIASLAGLVAMTGMTITPAIA